MLGQQIHDPWCHLRSPRRPFGARTALLRLGRPPAAKRAIDRDQVLSDQALALRQCVLLLELRALTVEHVLEIRQSVSVQRVDESDRLARGDHRSRQRGTSNPFLDVRRHRALDVLDRPEHRLLVGDERLLGQGVLELDVASDPTGIEDAPLERRSEREAPGFPFEEIARGERLQGKRAGQAEAGIEISGRDTDLRGLRRQNSAPPPECPGAAAAGPRAG